MGKALYRQYRSKSLAEIIGQEHITQTLDHALKQGTLSHAYLFTGPRGTGKTSIARILAHEVNKLPYSEQAHLDIIEIDAASNRRIDEIRELKERVHIAPTSAKYKVYIIDEVHMLTKEAFNALLKTLEEPPEHVIFILATTEAHKVPDTIISRTQRFTFKPVALNKVVAHLKDIAKKEAIQIDDSAVELIAAHGEGSFRDSISLLDQVRQTNEQITLEHIQQAIGQAPSDLLTQLVGSFRSGNLAATAASLADLQTQGIQPPQVARQLSQILRDDILKPHPMLPTEQCLQLLYDLATVGSALDPGLRLELAMYAVALKSTTNSQPITTQAANSPVIHTTISAVKKSSPKPMTSEPPTKELPIASGTSPRASVLSADTWPAVLSAIKTKHNTLYGITRMAVPSFESGKLTLSFAFSFHQKRLDDSKNKQLLAAIIKEVVGQDIAIVCVLDPSIQNELAEKVIEAPQTLPDVSVDLETISNIFGSAEVVE